jgi:N-acetylmuramoyl-L-alanine amidase
MTRIVLALLTAALLGLVATGPSAAAAQVTTAAGAPAGPKVTAYGDAGSFGSPGASSPPVAIARTPDGRGYWTVQAGGAVSAFGDATGHGGASALAHPVVGMAATPDGGGYWLVAADGGVFAYGDARFVGSAGALHLHQPVVGIAATPDGAGYWLVASDGGVFAYGNARFVGGGAQTGVVGMAPTPDGRGYWTVTSGAPLAGRVVAVDPGHDGGNGADPSGIGTPVSNGNGYEACDTVGTETAGGYTEHAFNFDVALRLQAVLRADGATVVLTRTTDAGVGPCINQRAAIGNAAHADAAVSIHADGGPVSGRGFTVIEPLTVHPYNDAIVAPSALLGGDMVSAYQAATGLPTSTYDGTGGVARRNDLGGLNLSTVPKVLIETANMQNPTDAALLEDPAFRQRVAQGIADGIVAFLPPA